ncbi:MAG: hypothetical protein OEY14_17240, partial [Myxococcales bacterium]|nr:hypothetical protein [Myxococcales bacterium]
MFLSEHADRLEAGALLEGCAGGDPRAWEALRARHAPLVELVVIRALDERRGGAIVEAPIVLERVWSELIRAGAASLGGACTRSAPPSLPHWLALLSRQATVAHLQGATPIARLLGRVPSPIERLLDDLVLAEPGSAAPEGGARAEEVTAALDRLAPQVMAILRMRLRGLLIREIAAIVGLPTARVHGHLLHVAEQVGSIVERDRADVCAAWRLRLGCASPSERVALCLRTSSDPGFARVRDQADALWAGVSERALRPPQPLRGSCLREVALARFSDGSMRGADRMRAEGHLATCGRCVDSVALLARDLRSAELLRASSGLDPRLQIAASCVAMGRCVAGEALVARALKAAVPRSEELLRAALLGQRLDVPRSEPPPAESSRVISSFYAPSASEAPLVAFEALICGDATGASRSIDDEAAREALGARLRLLAAAAGHDLDEARALAMAALRARYTPIDLEAD